ncbi:MAG: geranylgeranylglycerol-phosphate geranylgeranyltransferase, partial [Melioribacteraceae bacterium]|nr:geranylgeranylglycerol-phosphate geranylgeranyltransferase [Melioribacteraceae bacterium]
MRKLRGFFKIIRPVNVLITFLVFLVAVDICSDVFHLTTIVIWSGISAMMVAAAGNIINDYFDLEIDLINRPNRPIPLKIIEKNEAISVYLILLIASIAISYSLSMNIFYIVLLTNIFLFLYSAFLKKVLFVGNVVIAICTALVFIFGGIVVGNLNDAIIPAAFAFLINLIREILKDIEDLEGDKQANIITIPIRFGISHTRSIILAISLFLILLTILPFLWQLYKIEYLFIILFFVNVPLVYFLRELYSNKFLKNLS